MPKTVRPLLPAALNLTQASSLRLLVALTALLCGLVGLGAASGSILHQVYQSWQLSRSNSLTLYLPPEANPAALTQLLNTLPTVAGITAVEAISPSTVSQWLAPLGPLNGPVSSINPASLPLPTVVNVTLGDAPTTSRNAVISTLTQLVQQAFPLAEIDDHQPLLQAVAQQIQALQFAAAGLCAGLLSILILLIVLTTRTALLAQSSTLHLLLQLGATDPTLARTTAQLLAARVLVGYALGVTTAGGLLLLAGAANPLLQAHLSTHTVLWLALVPLTLPLAALLASLLTTQRVLRHIA
jgi:cell division protein FtsX